MTDPRQQFDDDLKSMLRNRAERLPGSADLADAALQQARGIRRRRRAAVGIAAATVLVAAAPVGASLIDGSGDDGSTGPATAPTTSASQAPETSAAPPEPIQLDVSLAELERGPDPAVPYVDWRTWIVDGEGTPFDVPNGHPLADIAQFDQGVVIWAANLDDGSLQMYPLGLETGLDPRAVSTSPSVDDATGAIAFALDGQTVYYGSSIGPEMARLALEGVTVTDILDVHDGVVVFAGRDDAQDMVGKVDFTTSPPTYERMFDPADVVRATAFSIAANLMGQSGQDTVPGDPNDSPCAVLTDLDDVDDGGWDSCTWRPFEFSPDGSRVFALDTRTEGFGPRLVAVVDSETGEALLDLSSEGTFGFAPSWESNDSVLVTLVQDGRSAIVRCTVGVGCELATDPKAAMDSLTEPYHLTAN
ncbi:MAG: hypothetical protein ACRDO2_08595 [Nocardioidaceae bacterium]